MKTKSKNLLLLVVCALFLTATAAGFVSTNRKAARAEDPVAITSVTLALGNSIAIRYYANVAQSDALAMRFTMDGKESGVVKAKADGENQVYFDFEIAPQHFGDEVTAELYDGENKLDEKAYSVKQYCQAKIANDECDAELKTLCADILAYGAAAQIHQNYKTDALVNAENAGEPSEFDNLEETDYNLTGAIDENTKFTGANCYFDGKNEIYFNFKTDDYANVTYEVKKDGKVVDYSVTEQGEGKYAIVTDAYAVDFDAVYTVSLKKGESVQTATYSLKSYVYYWQDNTVEGSETLSSMANLARALWNYGESSKTWYCTPVLSETDETVTVKAGANYKIPQLTATNRAGETLTVTASVWYDEDNQEDDCDNAVFYKNGRITYSAESHGCVGTFDVEVNVDYDGVNLVDTHYLDTAADKFYGIYGATFYAKTGGTQKIGRLTSKQIYDERIDVGMNVTSFVGSMAFNLRGGSETEKGLWIKVENSGGGRIQICNGSQILMNTDDTMPDTKGNSGYWDNILQKSFNLSVQVTDKKDESGNVTAIVVKAAIGSLSVTGDSGYEITVDDDNRATLTSKGWFFIEGGAATGWMSADAYVHSIYLNTPNYPVNLLLSGWTTKNSSDVVTGVMNENGMQYASVKEGNAKNTNTDYNRNYTDYGMYQGVKVKDQKVNVVVKAAFKEGDDFCVFIRGNGYKVWRNYLAGFFVSFSATDGIRICLGEAVYNYGGDTKIYTTYSNETIKALCGKTISELFADGVTLGIQATDVKDSDGNVTAVNVRIWLNGVAINGNGYETKKMEGFSMSTAGNEQITGDCIFNEGYLILGGACTDSDGYISGVYMEG